MENNSEFFGSDYDKYYRHFTGEPSYAELIAIVKDKELPCQFREELRGELLEMREELERILLTEQMRVV